ncbi:MAG TPA: hypothetical protein PK286_03775 [Devosia sp.]|nr:hypothetical protein [Devosia sp.]
MDTLYANPAVPGTQQALPAVNRVPEVDAEFWIIKLLAVTVGETAADFLAVNLGLGLATTTLLMSVVLIAALGLQFDVKRYLPWRYWFTVVLVSVVGTLITDNLVDTFGVPLEVTTTVTAALLALTFIVWFAYEHTLSIHTIFTTRREAFYWAAILLTFALGTGVGDYVAEAAGLGYLTTGLLFGAIIALIAAAYFLLHLNAVFAFWAAYILTRPLGASLGDLLSQPREYGGLGLGTVVTSAIFLTAIGALVVWMSVKGFTGRAKWTAPQTAD